KQIQGLLDTGVENVRLVSLHSCVKQLQGVKVWTRACDVLRSEIVCFVRDRLALSQLDRPLQCSIR
ncbi:MAG TPA: hypothetical protein VJ719_14535, partial [Chthoniobacterales bacterium]|nr:hypothetical protein [Chthoniobacterales bacterium]